MYPIVTPKFVENVKKSRENIALYCSVTFNRHTRHVVSPTPGKKPYFEPKEPSKFDKTDTTRTDRTELLVYRTYSVIHAVLELGGNSTPKLVFFFFKIPFLFDIYLK